jgi:cytochrome c
MQMLSIFIALAAVASSSAGAAQAFDAAAAKVLATKSTSLACHAADRKMVDPSYKTVAAKHQGQPDALENVAARVKSGGSGMRGPVSMPAQPNLEDDELTLLAVWVLAGAPDK